MNDNNLINNILEHIEKIKKSNILIAIDGCGGSGKSFYADTLKKENEKIKIVRMDDFYLPTKYHSKNGKEPMIGSNFDLKRLKKQVIIPVIKQKNIKYQRYDWELDDLAEWQSIVSNGIIIIEGVYSLHYMLRRYYDIKIWIDCHRDERLKRGLERDGESAYEKWTKLWMPLEDKYLKEQKPDKVADFFIKNNN